MHKKGRAISATLREPSTQRTESLEVIKPPPVQCDPPLAFIWIHRSRRAVVVTPAISLLNRRNSEECLQVGQRVSQAASVWIEAQIPSNIFLAFRVETSRDPYMSGSIFRAAVGSTFSRMPTIAF